MKAKGYMGGVLWMDFTRGTSEVRPLDDGTAERYLGRSGLSTFRRKRERRPKISPCNSTDYKLRK
jgi:hypothetical protein